MMIEYYVRGINTDISDRHYNLGPLISPTWRHLQLECTICDRVSRILVELSCYGIARVGRHDKPRLASIIDR